MLDSIDGSEENARAKYAIVIALHSHVNGAALFGPTKPNHSEALLSCIWDELDRMLMADREYFDIVASVIMQKFAAVPSAWLIEPFKRYLTIRRDVVGINSRYALQLEYLDKFSRHIDITALMQQDCKSFYRKVIVPFYTGPSYQTFVSFASYQTQEGIVF